MTGWPTSVVWHTPWSELELVAERAAKAQGKGFKRALTPQEQAQKDALLARRQGPT